MLQLLPTLHRDAQYPEPEIVGAACGKPPCCCCPHCSLLPAKHLQLPDMDIKYTPSHQDASQGHSRLADEGLPDNRNTGQSGTSKREHT